MSAGLILVPFRCLLLQLLHILTRFQRFVALAPTALIDAIVRCFNLTSSPNPALQNYYVVQKLLGPSHVPYSEERELIPFRALVRAYTLPLPPRLPMFSDVLPFFRGSVAGLAPMSTRGDPVARAITRRPMPKLAHNVRPLDELNDTERAARKVLLLASRC